jgi:N-acetylmuramic acid 6-phosphate etherase
MVRLGKTYGNLMVDLQATNQKLTERTRRLVVHLAELPEEEATRQLADCDGELKTAIVAARRGISPQEARRLLEQHNGHLRGALGEG